MAHDFLKAQSRFPKRVPININKAQRFGQKSMLQKEFKSFGRMLKETLDKKIYVKDVLTLGLTWWLRNRKYRK